jgi:hypothetical protein
MRWRALGLCAIAIAACSGGEHEVSEVHGAVEPAKDAIAKITEQGPVKATVRVWPAKPALGESIFVRLEIEAPPGISIEAPFQEAGDQRLGRFRVIGFARDTRPASSGGTLHEQTYTLEAQASGRHRVPPLRFEMLDTRTSDAPAEPQEVLTDEIPLEVAPVPLETAAAPLEPARGTLAPKVGGTSLVLVLGIASMLAVVISGSVLAIRGLRARRRIAQQRSAYDDAIEQLRSLERRGAPDAGAADAWFVELSAIVRRYLEHRYDIRAPELTTEEFLQVATARPELHDDHRALLSSFLERCDRVKFAGYRPDSDESLATLAAARAFVEDTRLAERQTSEAA